MTATNVKQLWPLLRVTDVQRSLAFYRDQLGFKLVDEASRKDKLFWCRHERGGACVMIQQSEPPEDAPLAPPDARGVAFYFVCEDADAMYEELTSRGMKLTGPTVAYYGMKQLLVPEPDGYEFCFESEVNPSSSE
jgi:catechol 2,3-dioxygenase-like lactoylglutathione lyase family enzyme